MRFAFIAWMLFSVLPVSAQRFGGHPPSVNWKQLNTDTARVIFPAGLDSQANRVASVVHYLASQRPVSLGSRLQKIDIVLQNQTVIANGYVSMGPYRSEFYLTPDPNNFEQGTIPWNDQLSLHEYRHVEQFNNFNTGLSHLMRVLFGQEGYTLAVNAAIPEWFFEGDAVYNETILSNQGRGRLPLFQNAFPALWQAGKNYSWMKLRNGSLKDYVPNHYYLGYLLVNYGREKYGLDFWTKVTRDAAAFKGLFYPFQKAIRKHAGISYAAFCRDAFEWYRSLAGNRKPDATQAEAVSPVNKHVVTDYYFPYRLANDSLLYLKESYSRRPAFYIRDRKGEHRLRTRDISIDNQYSYRNGKIVYASWESHPRWTWHDYSVIKVLDMQTKQQRTVTRKSKYFTPDISPSGERIAAVQFDPAGRSEIHIIETGSGKVVSTLHALDINLFISPRFIDEASLVCVVRLNDGRSALALANSGSGVIERLTVPSYNPVGYPSVSEGIVYFTASYGGNDGIYGLRLQDRKLFRVINGTLGSYFVNAYHDKLTWSVFSAEGYLLQQADKTNIPMTPVDDALVENMATMFPVSHAASLGDRLHDMPVRKFPASDYRKGTGLFNFHSWRPYYEDPIFTFSLYGENILNTLQTEVYYLYNQNEKTSAAGFSAVYGGWFPYLNIGSEFTFDRQNRLGNRLHQWNQLDSRIGLQVPLSFSRGRTFRNFSASSFYVLRNEFNRGFFKDSMGNSSFSYLAHSISWSEQVESAVQHIYPRLGYSLLAAARHPLSKYEGYQFYGSGALYLPGAMQTHNLVLTGGFQQRDIKYLLFSSRIANARGYEDYYGTHAGSRLWRLSANYHLPLFYPDWGFGNILYLQRFRANAFYDMQRLYSDDKRQHMDLRSAGVECYVDTKWWNQYPLTFGIRISHLLDDDQLGGNAKGSNVFEVVLPVSIFPK